MLHPIGVDVAPKKGGHIYDGTSSVISLPPQLLEDYLDRLDTDILVAWDAPLTGCADPEGNLVRSDLTQRVIDSFLARLKPPKGVSVLPYSGCPHWTITRRMLGLPLLGKYDSAAGLPFSLITRNEPRPASGRHVVEVHPAVALWFWFGDQLAKEDWKYKGKPDTCQRLWQLLKSRFPEPLARSPHAGSPALCDDELDAIVAWLLASLWLREEGVTLVGDNRTGAMLLPATPELLEEFRKYADAELRRRARHTQMTLKKQ